jgi:type I restriction enzyme S subunit
MAEKFSGFANKKLSDIIELKYGKGLPKRSRIPGHFPVYGSGGVVDFHNEALVSGPGIIVGRKGSIGTVFYEKNDFYPIDTVFYVAPKFEDLDLYYLSKLLDQVGFQSLNSDAAVPGLNREVALRQQVKIPPLLTQRKIAGILSAYDDLIENNLRRIKILEEMVQTLYREWFVKFRFPGHQKVKMVHSPIGQMPEGWEIRQIGEVIETLGGGTPSTKEPSYWEGGDIDWYSPSDLTASGSMFITGSSKKITQLGLDKSSAKLFPAYSLMMTSRATIGVVSINTQKACTNQGFITCVPSDRLSVFHLYFWIEESREKIISVASGATFKEISRGEFRELPIVVPPPFIENTFTETVEPMCRLIENLIKKNHNLVVTRDLLLPKLISGKLDVSKMDITIPEAKA